MAEKDVPVDLCGVKRKKGGRRRSVLGSRICTAGIRFAAQAQKQCDG